MKKAYKNPKIDTIVISVENRMMVNSIESHPYSDVADPDNNLAKDNDEYFGW